MGGQNHIEHWLEPVFSNEAVVHHETDLLGEIEHAAHGETAAAPATVGHAAHDAHAANDAHAVVGGVDHSAEEAMEWTLASASLVWALLGLTFGTWIYNRRQDIAEKGQMFAGGAVHRVLLNKYYVDEMYEAAILRPGYTVSDRVLHRTVDVGLIDGLLVNGSAIFVAIVSALLRLLQNGRLRLYAWVFTAGAAAFILYLTVSG